MDLIALIVGVSGILSQMAITIAIVISIVSGSVDKHRLKPGLVHEIRHDLYLSCDFYNTTLSCDVQC